MTHIYAMRARFADVRDDVMERRILRRERNR